MKIFKPKKVALNASTLASLEITKLIVKWLLNSEDFLVTKAMVTCTNEGHEKETNNAMQSMRAQIAVSHKGKQCDLELSFLIIKDVSWNLAQGSSPSLILNKSGYPLILLQRKSENVLSFKSTDESVVEKFRALMS